MPGAQHLLDTVLKDGLECAPWWPAWEAQAKVVSQWVHPRAGREWLQRRLHGTSPDLAESLRTGCDRFAEWRWKALWNATRDLLRMKDAVRRATAGLRACDLGSRDGVLSQSFLMVVSSDLFRAQRDALRALATPVADFSGWVRPCPCHEQQCLAQMLPPL